jgi:hypothetical protein
VERPREFDRQEALAARLRAKASCLVTEGRNGWIVVGVRAVKEMVCRSRTAFCYPVAKRREAVEKPRRLLEKVEVDWGRKIPRKAIHDNNLKR